MRTFMRIHEIWEPPQPRRPRLSADDRALFRALVRLIDRFRPEFEALVAEERARKK